jgi:hypothetical protein
MKKLLISFLVAVSFLGIAHTALAVSPTLETNPANPPTAEDQGVGSNNPINSDFQLVSCQGVDDPRTTQIHETECNYQQFINTVSRLIQFALFILIPIVLGMILYIGFKYLTANGDSGKLADAKRMIVPLLIGMFLIFTAWLIVYTFLNFILADNVSGVQKSTIVPASLLKP